MRCYDDYFLIFSIFSSLSEYVCVNSGLTSLSTIFSHITTVSDCDRELNAHFYSAASLKYHVQDT